MLPINQIVKIFVLFQMVITRKLLRNSNQIIYRGEIVNTKGDIVGRHNGIANLIGQRKRNCVLFQSLFCSKN